MAIQAIGCMRPRVFRSLGVRVGEPLTFAEGPDPANDPEVLRRVTDCIMAAIGALSGPETRPSPRNRPFIPRS